jgi:hypothetical protein
MTQVDIGLTGLTRLIRSLALMTVIKNLGRHTSQQYFSLRTNQQPATSQQYFSLRTNQHEASAASRTNTLPGPNLF